MSHPLDISGRPDWPSGSLQGYCRTTYQRLVDLFGQPNQPPSEKITTEWCFQCQDGTQFCIYDWKLPATPHSEYDWHIGGDSPRALEAFTHTSKLPTRALR